MCRPTPPRHATKGADTVSRSVAPVAACRGDVPVRRGVHVANAGRRDMLGPRLSHGPHHVWLGQWGHVRPDAPLVTVCRRQVASYVGFMGCGHATVRWIRRVRRTGVFVPEPFHPVVQPTDRHVAGEVPETVQALRLSRRRHLSGALQAAPSTGGGRHGLGCLSAKVSGWRGCAEFRGSDPGRSQAALPATMHRVGRSAVEAGMIVA